MKYLLLLATVALFVAGCSSGPMNQKYTEREGIKPLLSLDIKPPIDPTEIKWIQDAIATNERNNIPNEGKTFKELSDQGLTLYAEHKTSVIVDSMAYKVEAKQRAKMDK